MTVLKVFSSLVYLNRKKLKMIQAQLAHKAGVSRSTIIYYEKEKAIPTLEVALKICQHLNIDLKEVSRLSNIGSTGE